MKYIIRTLLLACCCMQAQAQAPWKPDTELEKQLQQSNHVATPAISDGDLHIVVIPETSPTSSTTSPEQSRRR